MASLQMLKSSPSDSHAKFGCFCSEFNSNSLVKRSLRLQNSGIKLDYRRFRVSCKVEESNNRSNGEESFESLFRKELRRRGMAPSYLLEGENTRVCKDDQIKLREENGGSSYSRTNGVTTDAERNLYNQRGTSMALNSAGVEGQVPQAKLLLTLGGAFVLEFWPLILATIASFGILTLYFGLEFVLDGSKTPIIPPLYIDPYAVLEEETIYKIAPLLN